MIPNKRSCRITVSGRVQGVGFRDSARQIAAKYRLTGWVRNTPDRSVEIECEGNAADIDAFILWLRKGPPYAIVSSVDITGQPYKGVYSRFTIEY